MLFLLLRENVQIGMCAFIGVLFYNDGQYINTKFVLYEK